jgi:hypothetical protein
MENPLQKPETLSTYGGFKAGCYRNVLRINYPLLAPELLIKLQHPLGEKLMKVQNKYLLIATKSGKLTDQDKQIYAENKEKSKKILSRISKEKVWEQPMLDNIKKVIESHMNVLRDYGQIILYGVGSFFFAPHQKDINYLKNEKFFCNTNKDNLCNVEYVNWMVVFDKNTHIMRDAQGLNLSGLVDMRDIEKYGSAAEDETVDLTQKKYRHPVLSKSIE